MAESVPSEAPWTAPRAAEWDAFTLHDWLCTHVESRAARHALATAIEGVFARNSAPTSLLAALFWIRCGDPLSPFLATSDLGPERRFDGGAEQLSAEPLGQWVTTGCSDAESARTEMQCEYSPPLLVLLLEPVIGAIRRASR